MKVLPIDAVKPLITKLIDYTDAAITLAIPLKVKDKKGKKMKGGMIPNSLN